MDGDYLVGVIINVYTFLFLIESYINSYYNDQYMYYQIRKIMKLKIFKFLIKQHGKIDGSVKNYVSMKQFAHINRTNKHQLKSKRKCNLS